MKQKQKSSNKFGGLLDFLQLSPLEKILPLERTKKSELSFGSLLTYSYLCKGYGETGFTDSCFIRTIYDIVPIPINRDIYSHK